MKRFLLALILISTATPASAELVTTGTELDEHLYLHQLRSQKNDLEGNFSAKGGSVSSTTYNSEDFYISKGQLMLSNGGFFKLLRKNEVGKPFLDEVNREMEMRSLFPKTVLGSLGVMVIGLGLGILSTNIPNTQNKRNIALENTGMFLMGLGGITGVIGLNGMAYYASPYAPRLFNSEQAIEAIAEYNRKLDKKKQP